MIKIRSILDSKLTWAIVLMLIFYIAFVFSSKYASILELKGSIRQMKTEIKTLQKENQLLVKKIELLKTDQYIEKIAREQLDLIKPNEILYKAIKED